MAHTISIPFQAARLRFITGDMLWMPVLDKNGIRIETSLEWLAGQYAMSFQKELLSEGKFFSVLQENPAGQYMTSTYSVAFEASPDHITHPAFEIEFDYVLRSQEGGFWGMTPVLGIEAFSQAREGVESILEELTRLEFSREGRLRHLQGIVSLLWFDTLEILETSIPLRFPTLNELKQGSPEPGEEGLKRFGIFPKISKPSSYCMDGEVERMARTLKSPYLRNIALVGPNGVGKTAVTRELIRRKSKLGISEDILETTASQLIKELTGDLGWQEHLSQLCKELQRRRIILFVRNLYELFEVGKYEGNTISVGDYLLPYIARGEITVIGECTPEEKSRIDLANPVFLSHFMLINLEEPREHLEEIILKKVSDLALNQKVVLRKDGIEELIRLNKRFTPYAGFPGKPIRFLESLLLHKRNLSLRKPYTGPLILDKSEIIHYFCLETGMPAFMADPLIPVDFDAVRDMFASNVFGQEQAVGSLVNVLASVKTAMSRTGKPIASFLFAGPTGVGKTELVKVLAEFMFGSRDRLTRFDMSEYSTPYSVMNLVGLDRTSEGTLINAVRREPFSVILFDEIEKAHYTFFDFLLQVLSEGRLTDNRGQTANFCSTIIILTSNIGARYLQSNRITMNRKLDVQAIHQHFMQAVQLYFRPELFNRIDQVISFTTLSHETVRRVVDREVALLKSREGIRGRKVHLDIRPEVLDFLADKGYDPLYGARYLQRTLQEIIAIPLACQLNRWDALEHLEVKVALEEKQVRIHVHTDPLNMDLLVEELEKTNLADMSADKRKELQYFEEGSVYLKLTNELAILERQKNFNQQGFWQDPQKPRIADQYQKIKSRFGKLKEEIVDMEDQVGMACMGFSPYNPSAKDHLGEWREKWDQFRTDLFHQLFPGDKCWLSIYGKSVLYILEIYYQLAEKHHFSLSGHSVWLRPSPAPGNLKDQANPKWIPTQSGKEHFYLHPWGSELSFRANCRPPYDDAELYGVKWKVKGQAAHWFFREEGGILRWTATDKEQRLYYVAIAEEEPKLPDNLHRKDFYMHTPVRRAITPDKFSDSLYKIKDKPFNPSEFVEVLSEILTGRLKETIEEALR